MTWRSSLTRSGWLACAALTAGAGPALSQHRAGSIEAGGYVQINRFDASLQVDNATGAGARFGMFLRPKLSLELSASWAPLKDTAGRSISYVPVSLFALFHLPVNDDLDVLLGPGYVHTEYGKSVNASADGFSALAGLRFLVTKRLAVRVDSRADIYSQSPIGDERSVNFGLTAGLSFFLGPQAKRDADGDGVDDTLDRCPGTRPGAAVDATGCAMPADTDRDGVLDPLDLCPDTPRGVRIDQNGCPLNTGDVGVFDEQDADTVRDSLLSHGIQHGLVAIGPGSDHPIARNDTPEGRAANRRATLRRID